MQEQEQSTVAGAAAQRLAVVVAAELPHPDGGGGGGGGVLPHRVLALPAVFGSPLCWTSSWTSVTRQCNRRRVVLDDRCVRIREVATGRSVPTRHSSR